MAESLTEVVGALRLSARDAAALQCAFDCNDGDVTSGGALVAAVNSIRELGHEMVANSVAGLLSLVQLQIHIADT
jgi:hypothetical protein